ncbi:hypothetical protein HU200_052538 [Digitaria exilis]|uniref:Kinesin-like protein n=1 Tax=Digitaria exilis TaxID=1010633 RepID=A0A835ANX7_9POAL|nr:hypothetical protein HU200_052538 [Digitaria exilis]
MSGAAAIGSRSGRWGTTTSSSSAATATVQPQVEYGRRTWALEPPIAVAAAADGEYSPGLLDLHSLDTELLTDMPTAGSYDTDAAFYYDVDRSFSDSSFANPINVSKSSSVAKIKVVVRKRPLNRKEISRKEDDIITVDAYASSLTVHETKLKVDLTEYMERHEFVFDAVLDDDVSNDKVYNETVEPIIPAIFQRTKATCFAYGQTGSGKTYTMQPLPLKASQDILRLMHYTYRNQGFQLFVSFFEIYGGKLFDLLNQKRKLCMREDGKQQVCIVGLQEYRVSDVQMIKELIERGNACRSTGTTGANEESSRSHAILQLVIKKVVEAKEPFRVVGKLSFIDLAGSERGADTTDNDKQTRIEGAEINKSLLALKECIRALDNDQVHIPFRGSKLTEVLRDSFIGNSRTVMISCISPNSGSCEHTLNTLRYADRVKSLSKGGTKKDVPLPPPSSNMRESSPGPPLLNLDYCNDASDELQRYGPKKIAKDDSLLSNVSRVLSGRFVAQGPSSYLSQINESSRSSAKGTDLELSEEGSEPEKPLRKSSRTSPNSTSSIDGTRKTATQKQWKSTPEVHANCLDANDELDALLKEEEDLVIAHREQVEESISILREDMKLLEEADQPGNQLDEYITKMNFIISKKAAGLMNLQARLARFQQCLSEQNVLVNQSGS